MATRHIEWQEPVTCEDGHIAQHTFSTATGPEPYHISQEDDDTYVLYFEDMYDKYLIHPVGKYKSLSEARNAAEEHYELWLSYHPDQQPKGIRR